MMVMMINDDDVDDDDDDGDDSILYHCIHLYYLSIYPSITLNSYGYLTW